MKTERAAMVLLIALSGVIISLCMGLRQSLGLFMQPMGVDLGISAAAFGFSIALQNIVWGASQPFVGAIADRHGARPVLIGTSVIYATGLLLMLVSRSFPGALEVAGFFIGLGAAGTFVIAPLGGWLIDGFGWRAAMVAFAAIAASMVILSLPIREAAPLAVSTKQKLRDAVQEAIRHRGYLFMTLAFFACGFQLVFITTHLPSYLALCGVAPGVGASALGLIGLFNALGTYLFGHLGARYSQKHLLALIYLARTAIIVVFLATPVSAASTLVFAAAMGFLWLGVAPLVTGIIARVFGLTHFNTLYGVVFFSHQLGSFFGAWMGGLVFDFAGNYDLAWGALIVIGLAAFTLQWLMDERPPPAAREQFMRGAGGAVA